MASYVVDEIMTWIVEVAWKVAWRLLGGRK
jgi:hypothetical protein